MSTHTQHTEINEPYFCTITCHRWLPLFQLADAYSEVYKWFRHLQKDDCNVLGYVIMPNHLHCLLFPTKEEKGLNHLIAEGKRFMAYGIVKRLKNQSETAVLRELELGVQANERKKGKKHQVFRLSFDAKECTTIEMLETKLDYIHNNPVSGKWELVNDFTDYEHSSAGFYEEGKSNDYVTHYKQVFNEVE